MKKKGYVYLVGAGPGDVRLLTIKGLQCLEKADVVLYDRLVNPLLLEWVNPNAECIYCGKLPDKHLLRQEAINELLVKYGNEGKVVVRLKGGDPSVFGRVGEEADALEQADVAYEIVPGITAAIGAATYAGIPVTHRDFSGSFAVVTGHDKSELGKPSIDWASLATGIDTIAFYMGVANIAYISEQLMNHGRSPHTPVLLIQWGTIGKQRTLEGTLETIASQVALANFKNPAVTLVGDVVNLRTKQSWFERQLLFDQHILYGTSTTEENPIVHQLREDGAEVFEFPRWTTKECPAPKIDIRSVQQILFTSEKTVDYFFQWLKNMRIDIRSIKADFYSTCLKTITTLERHSCLAKYVDEVVGERGLLILGEENYLKKAQHYWRKCTLVSTHREEVVLQSVNTFQRLLDEGRIKTIIFPDEAAVAEVTKRLAVYNQTPEQLSKIANIVCFEKKIADVAIKAGYHVATVLTEPNYDHLIKAMNKVELLER